MSKFFVVFLLISSLFLCYFSGSIFQENLRLQAANKTLLLDFFAQRKLALECEDVCKPASSY